MRHIILCFMYIVYGLQLSNCALFYTTNSEFGIFMAISVPLSIPNRNVFLSYNYEFNYYQPEHVYKYPPILAGEDGTDSYLTYNTLENAARSHTSRLSRTRRALSMMSRSSFYTMLLDKLDRSGYPAEACLLRTICETSSSTLGEGNGVLGSLIHIIFTPSSSRDESLPKYYYKAEKDGRQNRCSEYEYRCHDNILDFISKPLKAILKDLNINRLHKSLPL